MIQRLKQAGVNTEQGPRELQKTVFTGKTVVFTGGFESFSRPEAERLVRQAGGNASSGVSKKTDFVVCGNSPGSKYAKAKELGVKIISEKEFKEMIK